MNPALASALLCSAALSSLALTPLHLLNEHLASTFSHLTVHDDWSVELLSISPGSRATIVTVDERADGKKEKKHDSTFGRVKKASDVASAQARRSSGSGGWRRGWCGLVTYGATQYGRLRNAGDSMRLQARRSGGCVG